MLSLDVGGEEMRGVGSLREPDGALARCNEWRGGRGGRGVRARRHRGSWGDPMALHGLMALERPYRLVHCLAFLAHKRRLAARRPRPRVHHNPPIGDQMCQCTRSLPLSFLQKTIRQIFEKPKNEQYFLASSF